MKLIYALLTCVPLGVAVLLSEGAPVLEPKVTWSDDRATIEWVEPLADPTAAPGDVPFSVLSGPSIGWLTPTEAVIGWEVVAEKKLTAEPYASLRADYPAERIQRRSVTLSNLKPDTEYRYQLTSGKYQGRV